MIDLGATIATATAILSTVPAVSELIEKSVSVMRAVRQMKMDEQHMPAVIVTVIEKEKAQLEKLIDEYYGVEDDATLDSKEKKDFKKRIAAKICELLKSIEPIKDRIDGYGTVRKMYCESIPAALA